MAGRNRPFPLVDELLTANIGRSLGFAWTLRHGSRTASWSLVRQSARGRGGDCAGCDVALAASAAAQAPLQAVDVVEAAEFGDPVAVELLQRAARLVGETLAALVNFYTPAMVLLGAAFMVVDELLSRERIGRWIPYGTPAGRLALGAG
jgi:N-acetylglucosamine kinase-like BadF-type ATPase